MMSVGFGTKQIISNKPEYHSSQSATCVACVCVFFVYQSIWAFIYIYNIFIYIYIYKKGKKMPQDDTTH